MCQTKFKFDHLVITARSLEEGAIYVQKKLGIEMPLGGKHSYMGTHNLLLSLGADCYLEVIAIDPNAPKPNHPRWFNLDQFQGEPELMTWILNSSNLNSLPDYFPSLHCEIVPMSRGDLSWQITILNDGSLPMQGAFPSIIEWPDGTHPAANMLDLGIRLKSLTVFHPEAEMISDFLVDHLEAGFVEIQKAKEKKLSAFFETPNGLCEL